MSKRMRCGAQALRCTTAGNLPVKLHSPTFPRRCRDSQRASCWAAPGPYTPTCSAPASIRSVNSAAFEAPVVKNPTAVAARPVRPACNEIFASLPQQSLVIPAPGERREFADVHRTVCRSSAEASRRDPSIQAHDSTKRQAPPLAKLPRRAIEAPKVLRASKPASKCRAPKFPLPAPSSP